MLKQIATLKKHFDSDPDPSPPTIVDQDDDTSKGLEDDVQFALKKEWSFDTKISSGNYIEESEDYSEDVPCDEELAYALYLAQRRKSSMKCTWKKKLIPSSVDCVHD